MYDNLCTGHAALLAEGTEFVRGDIGDAASLLPALERVDAVMHFAAHAYVGESVQNPRKYFDNNVHRAPAAAEHGPGGRSQEICFLLYLCGVWRSPIGSHHRRLPPAAGKSVRRDQVIL